MSHGIPEIFPCALASVATETYLVQFLSIFPSIKGALRGSPKEKFLISNSIVYRTMGSTMEPKKKERKLHCNVQVVSLPLLDVT